MNPGTVDQVGRHEIDAVAAAFFRAVSFDDSQTPSYSALHGIFLDGGRLIRCVEPSPEISTVPEFIAARRAMVDAGRLTRFREIETAHLTEVFGNVAHRFSSYEKSGLDTGTEIAGRGVISMQLVRTPDGWRIASMAWDDERAGLPIPDRYR